MQKDYTRTWKQDQLGIWRLSSKTKISNNKIKSRMKKPFMKKEDLEKEYFDVSMPVDAICHVPLRQAVKVLGIKK